MYNLALSYVYEQENTLPYNQRTILIINETEDRSVNETAQIMALSPQTIVPLTQRTEQNFQKRSDGPKGLTGYLVSVSINATHE